MDVTQGGEALAAAQTLFSGILVVSAGAGLVGIAAALVRQLLADDPTEVSPLRTRAAQILGALLVISGIGYGSASAAEWFVAGNSAQAEIEADAARGTATPSDLVPDDDHWDISTHGDFSGGGGDGNGGGGGGTR